MANVEQVLDELRAGLKAGNVHAVKRATDRIIRMGLDPDLQLRAEQPLIERTLQILLRRGKEYQDSAHGPSQHFRTVAHIIDTLTPKDWPGITKILDDNKHEIVRDLLLRMREGWTASAMIAAKDLQRWGQRWPELVTIIHTAETDVDSSVDESRDDYTPGTESLLRYLRQDLDRGDYDAAMEMIGELAWPTHASMDLSALLNPHKTGLMRAMLTTMSTNDSEGVLYIMPQYLGGFAKLGVHWPEFETIERSVAAMSRQERESDVMEEAFDTYAKLDAESAARQVSAALHKQASLDPEQRAVRYSHWVHLIKFVPRGYVELLEPILAHHKTMIIGDLLRSMKLRPDQLWMVTDALDSLAYAHVTWPELGIIQHSIAAERQKQGLSQAVDEAWSKKYKKSINCSHPKGFSQRAHCAARRKRRAGGKTKSKSVSEAIRGQQRFIQSTADRLKDDLERGDWTSANYTVQRLNQTDPQEVQAIFEPLAPLFAKMIDDDPMGTLNYMNRIIEYADHAYPEMTAAYDAHKTEIMQDLLKMVRSGDHGDWVRQQIYQLRNCGVDWNEFNVITRSLLESADTAADDALKSEGREMVLDIFRRKLADGGQRGIYHVMYHMDDWGLKLSDWPELAEMIQDHKREIVRELLRIVNGDFGNDPRENRHSARFTIDRLRRIGMDWPELAVISRSMDADDQLKEEFGHFEEIAEVIASHMYDMAAFLAEGEDQWLVGALSDLYTTLEVENLDQQYWPDPEDYDIDVDAHKTNFVKGILGAIKQGEGDEAVNAVHMLKDYWHVNWPELDIILKSANADQTKQLDELKGYRADPVYAASQKEFTPSKMKTASERDMAMEKLTDYLETQGFKHIGQGSFSEIYLKPGYPWMFKLWSHDPAYLWWITWAAKHQDNPNVPRVKGLPVKIAPETYVVRLEKLRGLVPREGNLSKGYDRLAYLVDRIESVDDLSKEDLQWIRSEYPGVYDILRVIQRAGSSFVVDLHGDNIMLRGQVPVITDPVVG